MSEEMIIEKPAVMRQPVTSESKYSPSEEDEKHKKESARKALRQAQWEKDPDMFIHCDDVIFGAVKDENGRIGILSGGHERPVVEAAITRMTYRAFMMFQHMDLQQSLKNKNIITPPNAGEIVT